MKALSALIVSFMCLIFLACDGDEGGRTLPTPTPTLTPTPTPPPPCIPNEDLIDSECVAEDLYQACNRYFCEELLVDSSVDPPGIVPPDRYVGEDCFPLDCETIFCFFGALSGVTVMDVDGFPGVFGVFGDDIIGEPGEPDPTPDIEFGPCEFE